MHLLRLPKVWTLPYFLSAMFFLCGNFSLHAQFTINDTFGDLVTCDTMTRGIYIVWWDKDYDIADDVDRMLDSLVVYREACLNELGMEDPPNPTDGFFTNVYVHSNGHFSVHDWGNGVGTDSNGYPFYTAPIGVLSDWNILAHEAFHFFQYSSNSPGFAYAGDSQWYIEASANWFAARQNPDAVRRFIEAESLVRVPHVPLWLSFDNFPANYPQNWQRYVHQYALALHLYYLTDVVGVPEDIITSGLYGGVDENPQQYMYGQIGGALFRQHFIDWVAHMSNDFDFIPANQAAANLNEWNVYADPLDDNEFTAHFDNTGTDGWFSPESELGTHAWSFNTYKVSNNDVGTYHFALQAAPEGTYGDDAYFQGKILVKNVNTGASFIDMNMSSDIAGTVSVEVTGDDYELYFIVASMPEVFEDTNPSFQQFPYEIEINWTHPTSVPLEARPVQEKLVLARYNALGQAVTPNSKGLQIIVYDDGTVDKLFFPNY